MRSVTVRTRRPGGPAALGLLLGLAVTAGAVACDGGYTLENDEGCCVRVNSSGSPVECRNGTALSCPNDPGWTFFEGQTCADRGLPAS